MNFLFKMPKLESGFNLIPESSSSMATKKEDHGKLTPYSKKLLIIKLSKIS
jgi:hypothetical protein